MRQSATQAGRANKNQGEIMNNRIRRRLLLLVALLAPFIAPPLLAQTREVPKFEVDPTWPQLPSKWVWGQVSSVSIDERQHAWVL